MFSSWSFMVVSIVICCIFFIASVACFIILIKLLLRGGLQKPCPDCGSMIHTNARYCAHCGKEFLSSSVSHKGFKKIVAIFITCLIITAVSFTGIIVSEVQSGIFVTEVTQVAINFNQNSTDSGWNITFDEVRGGWLKKTINIKDGAPKQFHVQSHDKSGSIKLDVEQGNIKKEIVIPSGGKDSEVDLTGFKDGKASITVTISKATDGSINMWWE